MKKISLPIAAAFAMISYANAMEPKVPATHDTMPTVEHHMEKGKHMKAEHMKKGEHMKEKAHMKGEHMKKKGHMKKEEMKKEMKKEM